MKQEGLAQMLDSYARAPLLSRDTVLHLSRLIQAAHQPDATPRAKRAAHRARDRLIRSNLRLVVSIAKRFRRRGESVGLELQDLIQQGALGLAVAVEKFDPERGYQISTMATWWITQAVTRLIDRGGLIAQPSQVAQHRARLNRLPAGLSDEEVATAARLTPAQLEAARFTSLLPPVSTATPLRRAAGADGEGATLADVLAAPDGEDRHQVLDLEDAVQRLREVDPDAVALLELHHLEGVKLSHLAEAGLVEGCSSRQGVSLAMERARKRLQAAAAAGGAGTLIA